MSACVTNEPQHQDHAQSRGPQSLNGAARQRRRYGKTASSPDAGTPTGAVVLPFPSRDANEGQDHAVPSMPARQADVHVLDRPAVGRSIAPKQGRGRSSIGVLLPGLALPKELSGYRPQDVGLVTHAAIAILAPSARDLSLDALPEHVLDVTGALVNGDNVNRRRVLMLTAAGHVATYLRRFIPAEPWDLIGCEFDTGQGRTDLAWQNTQTGQVFFDEIKTHNRPITALSSQVVGQVKGQGEGGRALFGEAFAGVRLLPLGSLHLTSLIPPDRTRASLSPTASEPLRLTTDTAGAQA